MSQVSNRTRGISSYLTIMTGIMTKTMSLYSLAAIGAWQAISNVYSYLYPPKAAIGAWQTISMTVMLTTLALCSLQYLASKRIGTAAIMKNWQYNDEAGTPSPHNGSLLQNSEVRDEYEYSNADCNFSGGKMPKSHVFRALDALCETTFKEGKHKGLRFVDVIAKDPEYHKYLRNQEYHKYLRNQSKRFKAVYKMYITYADLMEMIPTMKENE